MNCIILAAGYATRMYPLTENRPKALLPFGGKLVLDWLIDSLKDDIGTFYLVTNHRFYGQFAGWRKTRCEEILLLDDGSVDNGTRLGAVRDLELAVSHFKIREDLLVAGADNLLDFSFREFFQFAKGKDGSCVMYYREEDEEKKRKTAIITVDEDSRIRSYEEKPLQPKSDLAVPPFYFYRKEDLRLVTRALQEGCSPDAPGSFAKWISEHAGMYAYAMPGRRYSIGDTDTYLSLRDLWPRKK